MGLRSGPLKVRLLVDGPDGRALADRALAAGLELAREGEVPDLVASLPAPGRGSVQDDGEARLSQREKEILEYLADGWSNAEIASVLGIGIRTVRFHLEGIYSKLGVNRRGEAVREAVRLGMIRFDF
ncbi:MAG TPA: helix-turn-helix transcriptional regulator [Rectinemataceae bacterium]|nr:helix-turn-helix transcriptional regulator [Rectinemataceae bacterium]